MDYEVVSLEFGGILHNSQKKFLKEKSIRQQLLSGIQKLRVERLRNGKKIKKFSFERKRHS